jgi:hypothetical protein
MDNEIESKGAGPEWLWAVWKRRKRLALAAFAVCFALLVGIANLLPDI